MNEETSSTLNTKQKGGGYPIVQVLKLISLLFGSKKSCKDTLLENIPLCQRNMQSNKNNCECRGC